jgi:hypothetical protein
MQDNFNTDDYFRLGIQGNEVIDSYFETLNTRGKFIWFNKLSQQSYINNNNLSGYSYIQNNTLSSGSYIYNNTLSSNSYIYNNTLSSSQLIFKNEIISKNVSNLEIRNSNVSIPDTATIIFDTNLSKTIFRRLDGTPRLQYVNNSDVIVITDVDA